MQVCRYFWKPSGKTKSLWPKSNLHLQCTCLDSLGSSKSFTVLPKIPCRSCARSIQMETYVQDKGFSRQPLRDLTRATRGTDKARCHWCRSPTAGGETLCWFTVLWPSLFQLGDGFRCWSWGLATVPGHTCSSANPTSKQCSAALIQTPPAPVRWPEVPKSLKPHWEGKRLTSEHASRDQIWPHRCNGWTHMPWPLVPVSSWKTLLQWPWHHQGHKTSLPKTKDPGTQLLELDHTDYFVPHPLGDSTSPNHRKKELFILRRLQLFLSFPPWNSPKWTTLLSQDRVQFINKQLVCWQPWKTAQVNETARQREQTRKVTF